MKIIKWLKNHNIQSFLCGLLGGFTAFILRGINYTLTGSLAEWMAAFGTIGAVWISLWLIFKENKTNISILVREVPLEKKVDDGIGGIDPSATIIEVGAYNLGPKPVSISFLGFRVQGTKTEQNEGEYIRTLDEIFDMPEMSFIQPGMMGNTYGSERNYLYSVGRKFIKEDHSLYLEAVFIDFEGKEHIGNIVLSKK
ncbi:hypothetical protein ABQD92_08605 [Enterococcus avium]